MEGLRDLPIRVSYDQAPRPESPTLSIMESSSPASTTTEACCYANIDATSPASTTMEQPSSKFLAKPSPAYAPPTTFRYFRGLPPEIRAVILEYALQQEKCIYVDPDLFVGEPAQIRGDLRDKSFKFKRNETTKLKNFLSRGLYQGSANPVKTLNRCALFQVCKRVYAEAFPAFMRTNSFLLTDFHNARFWLRSLAQRGPFSIGKLVCWVDAAMEGNPTGWLVPLVLRSHVHAKCFKIALERGNGRALRDGWWRRWADAKYQLPTGDGHRYMTITKWLSAQFDEIEIGVYKSLRHLEG